MLAAEIAVMGEEVVSGLLLNRKIRELLKMGESLRERVLKCSMLIYAVVSGTALDGYYEAFELQVIDWNIEKGILC
ncbi:hypothetical protein JTE90_006183 [Oedothorax gibbosus]|uniref:Uncharacterized protein n=1 Tax=Oedothorax gibbosus TaxID=931172 RepID=A0AAV6VVV8_9ARAC|nr:hypothetical protein JTE90_006183 [Oedothorax gibbosus]